MRNILTHAIILRLTGASSAPLKCISRAPPTANGFTLPAAGFNTFGIQAVPNTTPGWSYDQAHVLTQAEALVDNIPSSLISTRDYYISLDSGWSVGDHGDDYGRLINDPSVLNITQFAQQLHDMGLKLGVYILPGAFCSDGGKTIFGTDILINTTFSGNKNGFLRCDFNFEAPGTQLWHDSVVNLFASWGVDFIKLDYVTPGSPDPGTGANLPANNSGSVIAYHNAIASSGREMRLDISWKLERNSTYFPIWNDNADSMRTDQDINNSGGQTFVSWAVAQRAIENYRQFITTVPSEVEAFRIFPDMDNLYIGNAENITGVTDAQRQSLATHWIGASANLITGSDLTNLDSLGKKLLTWSPAWEEAAAFTAEYPMQPRNPGSGQNSSQQLQAWIAGPDQNGTIYVVLVNYGPDQGQGGFGTDLPGVQNVTATWADLGISGSYSAVDVWEGTQMDLSDSQVSASLDEGESRFLQMTPVD